MTSNEDLVNHPPHYAVGWSNGAEVIDITENLNFNRGNAVKYIARAGKKESSTLLEDLKKAQWYLSREIEKVRVEQESKAARVIQEKINDLLNDPSKGVAEYPYQEHFASKPKFVWVEDLPEPRIYSSLYDVPVDVVVVDKEGDYWKFSEDDDRWISFDEGEHWELTDDSLPDDHWDSCAPFTEVLDD